MTSDPSVIALAWHLPYFLVLNKPKPASSTGTHAGQGSPLERGHLCPHCRCPAETPACQGRAVKPDIHISPECSIPVGGWTGGQKQGASDTGLCFHPKPHLPRPRALRTTCLGAPFSAGLSGYRLPAGPCHQPPSHPEAALLRAPPLLCLEVLPARVSCPGQRRGLPWPLRSPLQEECLSETDVFLQIKFLYSNF